MKVPRFDVVVATVLVAAAIYIPSPSAAASMGVAANAGQPSPVQIGRGAKAWSENCARCHNFRDPKEFTDSSWDVIVNHMRVVAPLPGQVARDIKAFLKSSN